MLKRAIFTICGSRNPSASCLADLSRRAAEIAGRPKPWSHRYLYTLLHLERYDETKYPITDELLNAIVTLAGREATNGKHVVKVYARNVRPWSVILMRSRKCKRPSCKVHFVGRGDYCSERCHALYGKHLRRLATKKHRERARRLAARRRREKRRNR